MNEKSSILMHINQNQTYSSLCLRIKHTNAYETKPSTLMIVSKFKPTFAYQSKPNILMLVSLNPDSACL